MTHLMRGIRSGLSRLVLGFAMVLYGGAASLAADLMEDFNGMDTNTPITLQFFNSDPGIDFGLIPFGGPDDSGILQITTNGVNDNRNYVYFDRTAEMGYPQIDFNFDLKIGPHDASADGGSIAFIDTAIFGATGGPDVSLYNVPEDPAQVGVLGIGFDTWANGGIGDGQQVGGGDGSNYNDVSLYYNGGKIDQFYNADMPDVLPNGIQIDDDEWHAIAGSIDFIGQTVSMTIDGVDVWDGLAVPDLQPFESRVTMGARTGGENENFQVDNLSVMYIGDPIDVGGPMMGEPIPDPAPPTEGNWSVQEVNVFPPVDSITVADSVFAGDIPGVLSEGMSNIVNFADPQNAGGGYSINLVPKQAFFGDTSADDNDFVMRAIATVIIPEDGEYTFGFDGDDGSRLTLAGADFTLQDSPNGGTASGEVIEFAAPTGNSFTLASTNLTAGEHDIEVEWYERGGGAFFEVFAAQGVKTALDSDFSPVGQQEAVQGPQGTLPAASEWSVRMVDAFNTIPSSNGGTGLNTIADAQAAVALDDLDPNLEFALDTTAETINYTDPDAAGTVGTFAGDVPYDIQLDGTDDDDLAVMATTTVTIAEDGDYLFGYRTDDGASLTLEGADFSIVTTAGGIGTVEDDGQTLAYDANTGDSNTVGTTFLAAGDYELSFLHWERGGGASAEVFAGVGTTLGDLGLTGRLLGSPAESFDFFLMPGLQLGGEPVSGGIEGDYNGNGQVEQGDLDLVLLNWGTDLMAPWVTGSVDQEELDGVLLNWGNTAGLGSSTAGSVPEPSTFALVLVAAGLGVGLIRKR